MNFINDIKEKLKWYDFNDWMIVVIVGIVLIMFVVIGFVAYQSVDMSLNSKKTDIVAEVIDKRYYVTSYTTIINKISHINFIHHYNITLKYKDVVSVVNNRTIYKKVEVGDCIDSVLRVLKKKDKVYKDIVLR